MKGLLIVLLFSGQTVFLPFTYTGTDYDMDGSVSPEEQVLACDERAEALYHDLADHSWDEVRGQGWYLKDESGTLQGHIC